MADWKRALKRKLPNKLRRFTPTSFDVIGTIAIFNKFPLQLTRYAATIGKALLAAHPHLTTVCIKTGNVAGTYRVPKLKVVAGAASKETVHRENGCSFKLNVERCYFSPRLATERLRIAHLITKPERALVLFSGVAPYPCVIAKHASVKEVMGVELNRIAHQCALENLKLNRLTNVQLFNQSAASAIESFRRRKQKFDRIILPLPKGAIGYLEQIMPLLQQNGTVHLYGFAAERECKSIQTHYRSMFKRVTMVRCGAYAPGIIRYCLDLSKRQSAKRISAAITKMPAKRNKRK